MKYILTSGSVIREAFLWHYNDKEAAEKEAERLCEFYDAVMYVSEIQTTYRKVVQVDRAPT